MKTAFTLFIICFFVSSSFAQKAGTLDSSFGSNGKVPIPFSNRLSFLINDGFTQADNKTISVGKMTSTLGNNFVAIRYNSDGSVDSSFGNNGIATVSFNVGFAETYPSATQSDSKIILAGLWQQ